MTSIVGQLIYYFLIGVGVFCAIVAIIWLAGKLEDWSE